MTADWSGFDLFFYYHTGFFLTNSQSFFPFCHHSSLKEERNWLHCCHFLTPTLTFDPQLSSSPPYPLLLAFHPHPPCINTWPGIVSGLPSGNSGPPPGGEAPEKKKSQTMTNTDFSCSLQPNFGYNALGLANEMRARSARQVKTKMKTECCFSVGNECERVSVYASTDCKHAQSYPLILM